MSLNEIAKTNKKALRCLLWGTGGGLRDNYYLVKYYELLGEISIGGIILNDCLHSSFGGIKLIEKSGVNFDAFDVLIVLADNKTVIDEISQEAFAHGVPNYRIVPCRVMRLVGFVFEKYMELKKNPPTIFAPNCWGGFTYNKLALRFNSPFINMFLEHDDYLKFLTNPLQYMSQELVLKEMQYNGNLQRMFPVAQCGDIVLYFNHYASFDEAREAWDRRKKRIDWDNLFVMFFDEDRERVQSFIELPYEKKICFVPYKSENKDVISVEYRINAEMNEKPFWEIVNGMATGGYLYYDVLDLLLYKIITPVASFVL